jgi:cytosine/adenosine deaminase-related metal-dependent hydrolase
MISWRPRIAFVNARVVTDEGVAGSIRFGSRILDVGAPPKRGDAVVDLQGAIVLPGLVNAHDHLELNHYGRIANRAPYVNASEWIADMRGRLAHDGAIRAAQAHPLSARLFIGLLKNLLAGVTTVAHHNPLYRELRARLPIRVVRRYGWAHSFLLAAQPAGARGEPGGDVARRFRATPANAPFIVHLAEGVDDDARGELARFERLGCLAPNAVLVHGVAIDRDGWRRVARSGAGAVWCPASNQFLFGRPAAARTGLGATEAASRLAIGTDSRLTGARDLLDELRDAASLVAMPARTLLRMVTDVPADVLRMRDIGRVARGARADLVVIPAASSADEPGAALLRTSRHDVLLTVVDGRPVVGSPAFEPAFQVGRVQTKRVLIDGTLRLADATVADAIARCPIREPGVQCA